MVHLSIILELFSNKSTVNDHFILSSKKCFSVLEVTCELIINPSQPCTLVKLQVLYFHHLSKHCAPTNSMPLLSMATFQKISALDLPSLTAPDHQTWLVTADWSNFGQQIHFIVSDKKAISSFRFSEIPDQFPEVIECLNLLKDYSISERLSWTLGNYCSLCYFLLNFLKWRPPGFCSFTLYEGKNATWWT